MHSSEGKIASNYEILKASGYKVGSIVRISVKNFCTFSACEVFPGPKLNIIIGPNGTGKSALTHAICLACGGKADDTGRSNNISAFVKIGSSGESYTEVDILSFDKTVKTIRREINAESKASKWFLDGKKSTQNEIKQLVAKLQIDVDNLCSFMPQDRVGEFSRATQKKLLENTLMALENVKEFEISLIKEQMELSNIQGGRESLRRDRDLKQTQLETNRNEFTFLRNEMDRMQRREDAIRLKSFYEVKLVKLELDQAVIELEKKEKEFVAAEAQKLIEEAKLAPIELEERNARKNSTLYDKSINEATKKYQELSKIVGASMSRSDDMELEVESASSQLRSVDELKRDNEGKLHAARIDLRRYQHIEIEANEQMPLLTREQEVIAANISVCYDNQNKISNDINIVNQQTLQLRREGADLSKELENLQDLKQNYKTFLQKNDRMTTDSLSAMDWFSENEEKLRASHRIQGDVYGPVAMFCDVTDPHCAAMIENMVPSNRLLGFIVQYDSDRDFLMKEFRRLNYEIDIIVMKNPEVSNHRAFSSSQLDQLRDINIQGYLSDQIKCPDIIRSYLYIWHNVQSALWARPTQKTSIKEHHMESLISGHHKSFKLYVHCVKDDNLTIYNGSASRFQSNIGFNSRDFDRKGFITSRKQSSFNVEEKRNQLNSRIESSKKGLAQKDSELIQLRDQQKLIENKIQAYIIQRNSNRNKIKDFNQNREKIVARVKRVEDLEKVLSVGVEKEKLQREGEYSIAVQALFRGIQIIADSIGNCNDTLIEKAICDKLKFEIEEKTRVITERLELAKRDLNQCLRDLTNKRRFRDDSRKKQSDKEIELEQMIRSNFSISFEEFIEAKLEEMHRLCPEDTIDAVNARTLVLNHEITRTVDNPLLKERFERLKLEVGQQERLLDELNKQYESQDEILLERAEKWTRIVNGCITKLNELFRKYMRDLNFDGEVLLRNKGLFNDYELQLRVRFRAESDMCDLDGHRHSGGERAVSTAMFLMALQDMTSSPFRVVDEINQGMDENNERLVFDRIVTSCVGDETRPQYFVATPKLLQSLNPMIHNDVTILLVLNGPGTSDKWDFHCKLLEIKRKAAAIVDDEDSDDNNNNNNMLSSHNNNHSIIATNNIKKKLRV